MNVIRYQTRFFKMSYRKMCTLNEYVEKPEYPPIVDLSTEARKKREVQNWADQIKALKTVEEKQMKLNMPKYYGWKCLMLSDDSIPYDALSFIQHCTRTHIMDSKLPKMYDNLKVDEFVGDLGPLVQDAILIENDLIRNREMYHAKLSPSEKEDILADAIVSQINRIILNNLSHLDELKNVQVDIKPRIEAFWFIGGIDPPLCVVKSRENLDYLKHIKNRPINRAIQYIGKPSLSLRSQTALSPILDFTEAENDLYKVPSFKFDPRVLGYPSGTNRHGTNIPGFWPGDSHDSIFLSFLNRGHILNRHFGGIDDVSTLLSCAIQSLFACACAQANWHGFTTYNDVSYPFVAQNIVTNGRIFNFNVFQLNTISFHKDNFEKNLRNNFFWGSEGVELYKNIENNRVIGFNPDVLTQILRMYVMRRDAQSAVSPRLASPLFSTHKGHKLTWLESQYKHMMANKPFHLPTYEIYHWEKIYKIDNKTRVMEPRRRPFELGVNPYARRYDERSKTYIPKALRPGGPKSKDKFEKTYFP